ncbi:MAG: RagB/SusD family nutrient uptake outer membrane protein [Kofleriaceae bacterium]|nr:MAG: RagB/SusD family nutrient uptake outer membrane protein [Kofleriaceae bacterium]
MKTMLALSFLVTVAVAGCDLDVPDLNNPPVDDLEDNPTRENVSAASIGLVVGHRGNVAAANGYVSQLGILGRESYNFDGADPRYVGELLAGPLQKGSPFGGNFWAGPYANLRLATLVLNGADVAAGFSDAERAGVRGFAQTIMALDLLRVITTRDTVGAVIEVGKPIGELAPIAGKDAVYAEINRLLDDAAMDLAAGGDAFAFALPSGFAGFDDPAGFLTFNRAIRARVACYTGDYATALTALNESFIDETAASLAALDAGVYHTFSAGSGDTTNGLVNRNIYAHPSVLTDAQMNGAVRDNRAVRKTTMVSPPGAAQGLMSDLKFTMYSATAPVPIIRNEELLLLRAEAKWGTNDLPGAIADLDRVRTVSGGLTALAPTLTADEIETEILYNRRYSLLFEGGHRWIDTRRFDRITDLPLDMPDHVRNLRYPIPQNECDARGGPEMEPACAVESM